MKYIKDYTILIYANGNNDLEPEITKALLDIESIGSGENITIVIQLGRASKGLVKTIRKSYQGLNESDNWKGVRRYLVNSNQSNNNYKIKSTLLEDLGNLNMAKSSTLEEFITWGIKNFKAKKYALIVLGHGSGYMGVSHDFCQRLPSVMTIYGLKRALENSMMSCDKKIDILMFDSCYMNTIEVIYEITTAKVRPRFIITPELSPLEGLPYKDIIKIFKKYSRKKSRELSRHLEEKINEILKKEESKLYTYRLSKMFFCKLKNSINKIAKYFIKNRNVVNTFLEEKYKGYPFISLDLLVDILMKEKVGINLRMNIWILEKVISFIKVSKGNKNSLRIFFIDYNYYKLTKIYYKRMTFNKNNNWIRLLGKNKKDSIYDGSNFVLQEDMTLNSIYYIISLQNPGISKSQVYDIIKDLGWSKCPRL